MKHQVVCVFLILCCLKLISAKKDEPIHRFTSLNCIPGETEDLVKTVLCQVSQNGSLQMTFTFSRPITANFVQVTSLVKSGQVFHQLYQSPIIDFCGFMSGSASNLLLKSLIAQVQTDTILFHPCPYEGVLEIKNFDIKDEKFFTIYPSGNYKSVIKFFPSSPPNATYFATVVWETTIKSPIG